MDAYSEALRWMNQGISVIPINPGQKIPHVKWEKYQHTLPSRDELIIWFKPYHIDAPRNLGIVTGWRDLVVIDFDSMDLYFLWEAIYKVPTYKVLTSRGVHAYVKIPRLLQTSRFHGIDIKAGGGYVLGVPSVHPSGHVYQVLENNDILKVPDIREIMPSGFFQNDSGTRKVVDRSSDTLPAKIVKNDSCNDPWLSCELNNHNLVEAIKKRFSLLDFLPGATSTGKGWFIACCPLHDDHNPSMWIDSNRSLCGCYAGCNGGKSMDVINLYGQLHKVNNSEAINELSRVLHA